VTTWPEILREVSGWLTLVLLAGGLTFALSRIPPQVDRLLPPVRRRAVPWGGIEVLAAFLLVHVFILGLVLNILIYLDVLGSQAGLDPAGQELEAARWQLWTATLAFPLQMAALVAVALAVGVRPYQFGLVMNRLRSDICVGYLWWLWLTPVVLAVYQLVLILYDMAYAGLPRPHPFGRLAEAGLTSVEWCAVVFAAVAAAPILEETLFRGLVQPWLTRVPESGLYVVAVAFVFALPHRAEPVDGTQVQWLALLQRFAPAAFVLLMVPGYVILTARSPRIGGPIYATSLFFAAMHSSDWPTPIPLFVLGAGLGWIAWRTQGLVAPIVAHALFNGVACLTLWFGGK
jgi:membrane protease YdiL (CAAX protease family)